MEFTEAAEIKNHEAECSEYLNVPMLVFILVVENHLTPMLLVANRPLQNDAKTWKMIETLTNGYSFESTQWELSNEYQHDSV